MIYPDPCLCEETSVSSWCKEHWKSIPSSCAFVHVQVSPRSKVCDLVWGTVAPCLLNKPWDPSALSSPNSHLTALCYRKISVCSSQGLSCAALLKPLCVAFLAVLLERGQRLGCIPAWRLWLDSKGVYPILRYRQQAVIICGIADLNSTTYILSSGLEICISREVEKCLCIKEAETRIKMHF